MKVIDLFSGIGGFSLGLERAGMKTIAFCEIDKFCQKILKRHWPNVPIYNDVKGMFKWRWKGSKGQILLRQASRAKIYHTREGVPDFRASVLFYGGKSVEPFAWYDHGTRCWRTWQRCLIEGWEPYLGAWPRSGMMRNGIVYQLPTLAPLKQGIGSGLCATLTTMDSLPAKSEKALLREKTITRKGRSQPANLRDQIINLEKWKLPTMTASGHKGTSQKRYKGSKHFHGSKVSEALRICEACPTYLHPSFAELIMGFPIGHTGLKPLETQ